MSELQLAAKHVNDLCAYLQVHAISKDAFPTCCLMFCTLVAAMAPDIFMISCERLQRACGNRFVCPVMPQMGLITP